MRHVLSILFWLTLSLAVCVAQTQPKFGGFKGMPKSLTWYTTIFSQQYGQWIESPKIRHASTTWHPVGHAEEDLSFLDGAIASRVVYTYDSVGILVSENFYSGSGSLLGTSRYSYDPNGRILLDVTLNPNGSAQKTTAYSYSGNETTELTFNPDGTLQSKTITTHIGSESQRREYSADGTLLSRDDNSYYANGTLLSTQSWIYGQNGFESDIIYDSSGRNKEKDLYDLNGVLESKSLFSYSGDQVEVTEYNGNGVAIDTKRETNTYDQFGNLIRQLTEKLLSQFGTSVWVPANCDYYDIQYYQGGPSVPIIGPNL